MKRKKKSRNNFEGIGHQAIEDSVAKEIGNKWMSPATNPVYYPGRVSRLQGRDRELGWSPVDSLASGDSGSQSSRTEYQKGESHTDRIPEIWRGSSLSIHQLLHSRKLPKARGNIHPRWLQGTGPNTHSASLFISQRGLIIYSNKGLKIVPDAC